MYFCLFLHFFALIRSPALNAKCLDLYVQQIEAASSGETAETVIYLPMVDNGYYGWDVLLSDELMQTMLGGLQMPVSE